MKKTQQDTHTDTDIETIRSNRCETDRSISSSRVTDNSHRDVYSARPHSAVSRSDTYRNNATSPAVDSGRKSSSSTSRDQPNTHRPPRPVTSSSRNSRPASASTSRSVTKSTVSSSPDRPSSASSPGQWSRKPRTMLPWHLRQRPPFRPNGGNRVKPMGEVREDLTRVGGGYVDTRTGMAAGSKQCAQSTSDSFFATKSKPNGTQGVSSEGSKWRLIPGRSRNTARMHHCIDELIRELSTCDSALEKQTIKMEFTRKVRKFATTKPGGGNY
mmetsp:Transcript_3859/g.6011  ORF Transcript_3859/g.6011 Transcript_3859/m.6011 type:complete len:271 (-) Transcript_3859:284-1096(-)